MLEREFTFFLEHQKELLDSYRDKFVVICEDKVIGDYCTNEEALYQTKKTHKLGTFLIQHCTEGESAYTYTFHSHVIFENA